MQYSGNVNIITVTSDLVSYTVLIELYNFKDDSNQLRRIGEALESLFRTNVDKIVGNKHLSDYTKLQNQYPQMKLPNDLRTKFDDVGEMAIARGVTTRGKNKTKLDTLLKEAGYHLEKHPSLRVGEVFGSSNGVLSSDAIKYAQLDVEGPILLFRLYDELPVLNTRLHHTATLAVGDKVDVMPENSSCVGAIAQGKIVKVNGYCDELSRAKLSKWQVLVEIEKVFDPDGIIHYPVSKNKRHQCSCGCTVHHKIEDHCDFYLYRQYGKPKFHVIELKSRLRKTVEGYNYPECVYTDPSSNSIANDTDITFGERRELADVNFSEAVIVETEEDADLNEQEDISTDSSSEQFENLAREQLLQINEDLEEFDETVDEGDMRIDDDDNNSDENDAGEPTPEQIHTLAQHELNETIETILREADSSIEDLRRKFENTDFENMSIDDLRNLDLPKSVLADIFHLMDRAKVPKNHSFTSIYFRALRAAMFIMHDEDVKKVKEVLRTKADTTWEQKLAYDFDYIAQRVRRFAPPPSVLYNRLSAVFEFFKDKRDAKTGKVLFNDKARKNFHAVLELVKKGYASDPDGVCLYSPKTNRDGKVMKDKDGLPLYRSLRGTSNLESFHQYLTTSFGHTSAGPRYSDCLLTVLRHFFNWRMSLRNRPNFPKIRHYHGLLIDRTNALYEEVFGHKKYDEWISFAECLPAASPFGVVPVSEEISSAITATEHDEKLIKANQNLSYLARRQKCPVPVLPVRGKDEYQKYHRHMQEALANNQDLNTFTAFRERWNASGISVQNKIFPKSEIHLCRHFKGWTKNRSSRDAEVSSGSHLLINTLQHVPASDQDGTCPLFKRSSIQRLPPPAPAFDTEVTFEARNDNEPHNEIIQTQNIELTSNLSDRSPINATHAIGTLVNREEINTSPVARVRKRVRLCKNIVDGKECPNPLECRGSQDKSLCILLQPNIGSEDSTATSTTKRRKRKYTKSSKVRICSVCGLSSCRKGVRNKKNCENKPS